MHEQAPGTPRVQSGFRNMVLSAQSLLRVRRSPSVSENSSQVRPCQASMHSTKSLPPSRPQRPLCRQAHLLLREAEVPARKAAEPGTFGHCPHLETTHSVRQRCPSPTPQAKLPGGPHWLDPVSCVHIGILAWGEKNTCWPLRAAPFPEGAGCSPKPTD